MPQLARCRAVEHSLWPRSPGTAQQAGAECLATVCRVCLMAQPGSVPQPAPGTLGVRLGAACYAPVGPGMAYDDAHASQMAMDMPECFGSLARGLQGA